MASKLNKNLKNILQVISDIDQDQNQNQDHRNNDKIISNDKAKDSYKRLIVDHHDININNANVKNNLIFKYGDDQDNDDIDKTLNISDIKYDSMIKNDLSYDYIKINQNKKEENLINEKLSELQNDTDDINYAYNIEDLKINKEFNINSNKFIPKLNEKILKVNNLNVNKLNSPFNNEELKKKIGL